MKTTCAMSGEFSYDIHEMFLSLELAQVVIEAKYECVVLRKMIASLL